METVNAKQAGMPLQEINMESQDNKGKFDFQTLKINQSYLPQIDKDIVQAVRKIIDQLDVMDRSYFGKDRQKQIKAKIQDCISMLDQKPIDMSK